MFDTVAFLTHHFTSPQNMVAEFDAMQLDGPTVGQAHKWWVRGTISGEWWPYVLLAVQCKTGRPVDLIPFLKDIETNDVP